MAKFQFKYEITIVDFDQYLLKSTYQFNHNFIKIPLCMRHPVNNLPAQIYRFFTLGLLGEAVRKKSPTFIIGNVDGHSLNAQWAPKRLPTGTHWVKHLEEKQLLRFKDLIRFDLNRKNSPFPIELVNKSESPTSKTPSQNQQTGAGLKTFSWGEKTKEDLLKESDLLELSEEDRALLKSRLRVMPK